MNRIKDYSQLATDISKWVKDYAGSNNIKSLVVGVSGGIDSAVVSTLCAMSGITTYLCIINIHSNAKHLKIAEKHGDWLTEKYGNVVTSVFEMTNVFENYIYHMGSAGDGKHGQANSKSRLRMMSLYQMATSYKGIVVGTGNKVEDFGVGFFTKYGDGGVDISPIANLYKTEVRELGRHLGISQEILDAAPTDGLWDDGRTDEQQIGATYEELEWAMDYSTIYHLSELQSKNGIGLTNRQQEVLKIYRELNIKNQHKIQPIPVYKVDKHI